MKEHYVNCATQRHDDSYEGECEFCTTAGAGASARTPGLHLTGRIVLNVRRLLRPEVSQRSGVIVHTGGRGWNVIILGATAVLMFAVCRCFLRLFVTRFVILYNRRSCIYRVSIEAVRLTTFATIMLH